MSHDNPNSHGNNLLIKVDMKKIKNGQKFYLRSKKGSLYINFTHAVLVNKFNEVLGFVLDLNNLILLSKIGMKDVEPVECGLTCKQWEKKVDNSKSDGFILYPILYYELFENPVDCLSKPVRGMRYSTCGEDRFIEYYYFKSYCKGVPVGPFDEKDKELWEIGMRDDIFGGYLDYTLGCDRL